MYEGIAKRRPFARQAWRGSLALALAVLAGCEPSTGPSIALSAGFLQMQYTGSIEGERDVTEGTYFAITVPDVPAGTTVPIDVDCFELNCSSTLLFFGVGPNRPHEDVNPDVDRACWIETGTLTVTGRTEDRVEGTFSGEGGCVFDNRTDPITEFSVGAASFDVPISFLYRPRIDLR